jgi:chromosome partitioning protein
MSGKVISVVNRKGGVGKTTLTVGLADALVSELSADVAVVDLDPQGSASRMLMSDDEFAGSVLEDRNLWGLMHGGIHGAEAEAQDVQYGMRHKIRGREGVNFGLIPNSDRFWDLEAEEVRLNNAIRLAAQIERLLARLVETHQYVIVDCPPGQTFSTRAALGASDLILVPTTPDRLSIWGMDLFRSYIAKEANEVPFKFVITRYQANRLEARNAMDALSQQPDMLQTVGGSNSAHGEYDFAIFSEMEQVRRRIQQDRLLTLSQIYGRRGALELSNIVRGVQKELGEPHG